MAFGLLYDYLVGNCIDAYTYFGAHFTEVDGKKGVIFRLYAPGAKDVSVIGDWNSWDVTKDKMNKIDECGCYELFIPNIDKDYLKYKYHFKNARGKYVDKADPFAFFSQYRPETSSVIFNYQNFTWNDFNFMSKRTRNFDNPMSIYEVHLGSWTKGPDGRNYSYEEMADLLIPYIKEMGYTHIELMPVTQYPFDGSWGYQATGFFSADSRYGNPKQLMQFVNKLHQNNIGVIIDIAPAHFANDEFGLINFDGAYLFESKDKNRRYSPWGSAYFDLGHDPVRSFLMSSMNYFATEFHFDGIRVDAVSNMLFYDGNKDKGKNDGSIEFLKRLNYHLHNRHSSLMMIAEDSSDFPGVTKPIEFGGIGFDYKWDLGWMNDTLKYYGKDPVYRKYEHNKLMFSMAYFFNENFMLPLSHDEVVHGKGTIINKMWGDYNNKFSQVRNLYVYQFAHPGKKLNFMGNELATFDEWAEDKPLAWNLLTYPKHDSVKRLIRDLNKIYIHEKALHYNEHNPANFKWLMTDNYDNSVIAFERFTKSTRIIAIFNMTPNYYENFTVGMYHKGVYEEIMNSDKDVYGGDNQYNGLPIKTNNVGLGDKPYSITIKLASFGAILLRLKRTK